MRAEHFFRTESTQFGLCTEDTYNELVSRFGLAGQAWFLPYAELARMDARFRPCFNLEGQKFKGNVLNFRKDYAGLHPTQKPVALFEYLIRTYTNEGDTVLDNCCGSGTTGVACQNTGRNFIQMELSPEYCEIARGRLGRTDPAQPARRRRTAREGLLPDVQYHHARAASGAALTAGGGLWVVGGGELHGSAATVDQPGHSLEPHDRAVVSSSPMASRERQRPKAQQNIIRRMQQQWPPK